MLRDYRPAEIAQLYQHAASMQAVPDATPGDGYGLHAVVADWSEVN